MNQPNSRPTSELMLRETASQTAGPYVHIGLALAAAGNPTRDEEIWNEMARPEAEGEHIEVVGTVIDGNGDLVRDAFIEAWQANSNGEYQPEFDLEKPFNSFGRTATTFDHGSEWSLTTVKPGPVAHASGQSQAPHINLAIFARGINIQLQTRLYFDDEAEANASCPVLSRIESPTRRQTLIARREEVDGKVRYRLDIRLQGEGETVFFDF
ncbi:protocatechuate 3,4-dioxygenase subunit alpha [Halomonas icarae]|uniref:Protocatechuate 3,4-dioxygenase subunit alpha n=1 Tax=Halomonas icarae TaxID=2691040 RepID=A0A7X4W3Z0_9GAMM|nr:protocatechuate 3,4-dioxygenase subunit alpha [Halomonas icarae]MDR5903367.1 protocatechuate 3,4-dioxygenase subunit alpha [Halomonas icarae]NAW14273.1 protocatechuate 3,4-dioxygenase subunit alpha [Halomonas icarae]